MNTSFSAREDVISIAKKDEIIGKLFRLENGELLKQYLTEEDGSKRAYIHITGFLDMLRTQMRLVNKDLSVCLKASLGIALSFHSMFRELSKHKSYCKILAINLFAQKVQKCVLVSQSCPTLVTTQTVARQAPLSMGSCRQENWSGLPFPSPVTIINSVKERLHFLGLQKHCRW